MKVLHLVCGPQTLGVHIRQTSHVHVTNTKCCLLSHKLILVLYKNMSDCRVSIADNVYTANGIVITNTCAFCNRRPINVFDLTIIVVFYNYR